MTKKDFLEMIKDVKDNEELSFYVWDCENDNGEGEEVGKGKAVGYDGEVVYIRVN